MFNDFFDLIYSGWYAARDREKFLNLYTHNTVVVVGCGGIGSWIGLLSAYVFRNIILIDPDKVEVSNLHRTPYFAAHVGCYKVNALAQLITLRYPNSRVFPINQKVDDLNIDEIVNDVTSDRDVVVFDCRDSLLPAIESQHLIIRLNYDGFKYSIIFNPDYNALMEWDDEPETAGYRITPSCQSVPVMLSAFVLQLIQNTPPTKISTLKKYHKVISGDINTLLLKIFKS